MPWEKNGNYWLGLYWRNNKFNINIMIELCQRCIDTELEKICLTPWKSFIVKGIKPSNLVGWEKLMGRVGMNLRHSSLELNWHLPALDREALDIKNYLVRSLDQQDISTSGLSFTIKNHDEIYLFTSIVIAYNQTDDKQEKLYDILYSDKFNPNSDIYHVYASNIPKEILPALLVELSLLYYDQLEEVPVDKENQ